MRGALRTLRSNSGPSRYCQATRRFSQGERTARLLFVVLVREVSAMSGFRWTQQATKLSDSNSLDGSRTLGKKTEEILDATGRIGLPRVRTVSTDPFSSCAVASAALQRGAPQYLFSEPGHGCHRILVHSCRA